MASSGETANDVSADTARRMVRQQTRRPVPHFSCRQRLGDTEEEGGLKRDPPSVAAVDLRAGGRVAAGSTSPSSPASLVSPKKALSPCYGDWPFIEGLQGSK